MPTSLSWPCYEADIGRKADLFDQFNDRETAAGNKDQSASRQLACDELDDLPRSLSQFLVLPPALLIEAFARTQRRQEWQSPAAPGPANLGQRHTAQPPQSTRFYKMRMAGAYRVAVNAFSADMLATPSLNRVIKAENESPCRGESGGQQAEQNASGFKSRPPGAIENAMVSLEVS